VKLKIDMLNTSMALCLRHRRRKIRRRLWLKLCSLVFMIYPGNTITDLPTLNHEALAGFFNAPFEGEETKVAM